MPWWLEGVRSANPHPARQDPAAKNADVLECTRLSPVIVKFLPRAMRTLGGELPPLPTITSALLLPSASFIANRTPRRFDELYMGMKLATDCANGVGLCSINSWPERMYTPSPPQKIRSA